MCRFCYILDVISCPLSICVFTELIDNALAVACR